MSELQQLEELQRDHRRTKEALKTILMIANKKKWWGWLWQKSIIKAVASLALEENEQYR